MPVLVYSALRLLLFAVALVALAWAGMGSWLLVLVAAVTAFLLSQLLLKRQRDAAGRYLQERAERRKVAGEHSRIGRAIRDDEAAEDAAIDHSQSPSPKSTPKASS